MKTFILIGTLSLLFASEKAISQINYFEGRIIFKTSFDIKDSTRRAVLFSTLYPTKTIQYFKEGNTFETYDKGANKKYLYLRSENKIYENRWSEDTLYFFDCSGKGREILNLSLEKNSDTVLGLRCHKLQVTYLNGTSTYYFNENSLPINSEWYSRLTFINWDTLSKLLRSIPLKTIIERSDYRIINTASSIKHEKIPKTFFMFPPKTILVEDK